MLKSRVSINISIDGVTKEVYEYIRHGASFDKLMKNGFLGVFFLARRLLADREYRRHGCSVYIVSTVCLPPWPSHAGNWNGCPGRRYRRARGRDPGGMTRWANAATKPMANSGNETVPAANSPSRMSLVILPMISGMTIRNEN